MLFKCGPEQSKIYKLNCTGKCFLGNRMICTKAIKTVEEAYKWLEVHCKLRFLYATPLFLVICINYLLTAIPKQSKWDEYFHYWTRLSYLVLYILFLYTIIGMCIQLKQWSNSHEIQCAPELIPKGIKIFIVILGAAQTLRYVYMTFYAGFFELVDETVYEFTLDVIFYCRI